MRHAAAATTLPRGGQISQDLGSPTVVAGESWDEKHLGELKMD